MISRQSRQVRQILESKISILGARSLNEEQGTWRSVHPPSAEAAAFAGDGPIRPRQTWLGFCQVRFGPRIENSSEIHNQSLMPGLRDDAERVDFRSRRRTPALLPPFDS